MKIVFVLTMVSVAGIVWGGFLLFLSKAIKHEKKKRQSGRKSKT